MIVRCRLFWRPGAEDPSLHPSESPGSVYTAFAALYFPAAVRFIAVLVWLDVERGWREGRERAVADGVATVGVVEVNLPPGGLDVQSAVSVVDSLR